MTTFQEREQAFEAKFAHDEEFRFLVTGRRDKLFAQWAADRLKLPNQARLELTASVIAVRDGAGHDELLLQHIMTAFSKHGVSATSAELSTALASCASQARQALLDGPPRTLGIL